MIDVLHDLRQFASENGFTASAEALIKAKSEVSREIEARVPDAHIEVRKS
ncbi:hypothetical protein ACFFKB_04530 [Mameliella alba]|nr:hypothetical protein [Mameliella alba]